MSAEKIQGDQRLDQDKVYSIEEYIFQLTILASRHSEGSSVRNCLENMVAEAEDRPSGTLVEFEEQEDGLVGPVFSVFRLL